MAREFGIEPLADKLFADPTLDPAAEAVALHPPPEVLDDGKTGADFRPCLPCWTACATS